MCRCYLFCVLADLTVEVFNTAFTLSVSKSKVTMAKEKLRKMRNSSYSLELYYSSLINCKLNWDSSLYCRAKAKDRNFVFCRKGVIDIFGTFKTSFIMYISILSQFSCFSEKIMGRLNRNFEKPRRNQGRTQYNTSKRSFTLFGTLKMSYAVLPLFNCASKWSCGASLELYGVLPFFYCPLKSAAF